MTLALRLLLRALAFLPRVVNQRLGRLFGYLSYWTNSRAVKVTRTNLALCRPGESGQKALVRRSLVATGQTIFETPAVWLGNPQRVGNWIAEVHNEELLQEGIQSQAGLLLLLPHLGNWELFNVFSRRYQGGMTILYQPPRQTWLRNIIEELRSHHGNQMVPTTRAGLKVLFQTLRQGGTALVLPDQVPTKGSFVPFFGEAALTDELSARLLAATGAKALGVAVLRRTDGRFAVHFKAPDATIYSGDVLTRTLLVNQLVESLAQLAPEQYQWEYKRYRVRPEGKPDLYEQGGV